MIDSFVLLTPILMLGVVALLVFVGCDVVLGLDRDEPKVPVLTAVAGDGKVDLSWPVDVDAGEFRVKRGEISGVHETIAVRLSGNFDYTDNNVVNGTTYFYVVSAVGGEEGETADSNEEMVTPEIATFVTKIQLGTLRSNFNGWVGMAIQMGASSVSVVTLGRVGAPMNGQTHTVKIVNAANGQDLLNGSVPVDMTGSVDKVFKYSLLPNPVTLSGSGRYYILSEETSGGDQFYNHDAMIEETTGVAAPTGAVFGIGTTYTVDEPPPRAYPVNFQYRIP